KGLDAKRRNEQGQVNCRQKTRRAPSEIERVVRQLAAGKNLLAQSVHVGRLQFGREYARGEVAVGALLAAKRIGDVGSVHFRTEILTKGYQRTARPESARAI